MFKERSKDLTVKRVMHYWSCIKDDLPFLSADGPAQSLAASPFETLDQLLSYIESYCESNRPVKMLARGFVDEVGQSVLKLSRYNICPKVHYRVEEDLDPSRAEMLLVEAIESGRGPIMDVRLSAAVSATEDRIKAWYELLYNLDDNAGIAEMHRDVREYLRSQLSSRRISLDVAKSASTGSSRLDDLRWSFLLWAGMCSLSEAWTGMRRATLWLEPEAYENGRYHGEYDVIKKREDLTIRITYRNQVTRARANRPEKVVKRTLKSQAFDSIDFEDVRIPDGVVTGIQMVKGTRMMVLDCEDGVERYVTVPQVNYKHLDHIRSVRGRWLPAHIERWLQRESLQSDEFETLVRDASGVGLTSDLSRSMIRAAGKLAQGRLPIQIRERLAARREPMDLDNIEEEMAEFAMLIAPTEPLTLEEMYGDFSDEWIIGAQTDVENLGMEMFAIEETFTALEVNRTIRDLLKRFEIFQSTPLTLFGSELRRAVEIYKEGREATD